MGLGSFFKKNQSDDCHIEIDADNCEGCGKCITACQNNDLILEDNISSVRDHQVCRSCKICVAICPNDYITVK